MDNAIITVQTIAYVCGFVITISGAYMAIKKALKPLTQMREDIDNNKREIDEIKEIKEDVSLIMQAVMCLLKHAETGNNTGEMKKKHDEIVEYLSKK